VNLQSKPVIPDKMGNCTSAPGASAPQSVAEVVTEPALASEVDAEVADSISEVCVGFRPLPASVQSVAIITGGGSGIGRALALKLAAAGSTVVIVGRRADALGKVAGKSPEQIFSCPSDVATPEGRAAIADFVGSRSVHVLVHGAASCQHIPLTAIKEEDYQREQRINVEAPIFLTQALMANLKACQDKARVLMVSSGAADQAVPMMGAYCMSKAAMKMLWMHLRDELKDSAQVGYCVPGLVNTEITDSMATDSTFVLKEFIAGRVQSGDIHQPEEVAGWMAALLDRKVCTDEDFTQRENNIDIPEHSCGLQITLTMEAKLIAGSA